MPRKSTPRLLDGWHWSVASARPSSIAMLPTISQSQRQAMYNSRSSRRERKKPPSSWLRLLKRSTSLVATAQEKRQLPSLEARQRRICAAPLRLPEPRHCSAPTYRGTAVALSAWADAGTAVRNSCDVNDRCAYTRKSLPLLVTPAAAPVCRSRSQPSIWRPRNQGSCFCVRTGRFCKHMLGSGLAIDPSPEFRTTGDEVLSNKARDSARRCCR